MVRVPCYNCGIGIDLEPGQFLADVWSGYDTLCKECKCHIESDKIDKKLDKLLKRNIWQRIKQLIKI